MNCFYKWNNCFRYTVSAPIEHRRSINFLRLKTGVLFNFLSILSLKSGVFELKTAKKSGVLFKIALGGVLIKSGVLLARIRYARCEA